MAAMFPINALPPELLMEILSQLSWRQQLGVRRVSHQWLAAVDACLVRRQELKLSRRDQQVGLTTERLLNLLQSMPALKRLYVNDQWLENTDLVVGGLMSVDQLCDNCPQLQAIHLSCELDDAGVGTLLRRLPGLRSLKLYRIIAEGDCLSLLPAELQSVSLSAAMRIKSASLRHLTRCQQLRELDLYYMKEALSEDLAVVVSACPQLERLSVKGCDKLTGDWLPKLRRCPQLRDLDLSHTLVRNENLVAAMAACPQLERLTAAMCSQLTGDWLTGLKHCPRLRDLDLSHTTVRSSKKLAAAVAACPQLERLVVKRCYDWLTWDWLPQLSSCPQLRDLDLSNTNVQSEDLAAMMAACPQLERLVVAYCEELKGDWLPELRHCPRLRDLDLRLTYVKSGNLAAMAAACPQLERLSVARCPEMTGDWMPELRRCPQLRDLNLSNTNVRSKDLAAAVVACPQLERLAVVYCPGLKDDWLPELRHCPRLRDLDLSHNVVRSKKLAVAVAACPQLERLSVERCRGLTSGWLPQLKHCTRLRDLNLSYTEARSKDLAAARAVFSRVERLDVPDCTDSRRPQWLDVTGCY